LPAAVANWPDTCSIISIAFLSKLFALSEKRTRLYLGVSSGVSDFIKTSLIPASWLSLIQRGALSILMEAKSKTTVLREFDATLYMPSSIGIGVPAISVYS